MAVSSLATSSGALPGFPVLGSAKCWGSDTAEGGRRSVREKRYFQSICAKISEQGVEAVNQQSFFCVLVLDLVQGYL